MKNIWMIAINDLRMFLRDKASYVWLLVMPMLFTFFFGIAMKGDDGKPKVGRADVYIENLDTGYMGDLLVEELTRQGVNALPEGRKQNAPRGIRIPKDFTEKIQAYDPVNIDFYKIEGKNDQAAFLIQLKLFKAVMGLTSDLFTLSTEEAEAAFDEASLRALMERETKVSLKVSYAGRKTIPGEFEQSVPGYMVMFTLMNLLFFGAISVSSERTNGVLRRLASYPISRNEIIIGKITGRMILGIFQILFFMIAGKLVFKVDFGPHPILIFLTMIIYAWGCASLGVFIRAMIKGEDKVSGICLLISMAAAALGGCWWPIEVVPDTMRAVGHIFPTAWTMDALHQLISFQGGFEQILHEAAALAGYAVVFTLAAAKTLRW